MVDADFGKHMSNEVTQRFVGGQADDRLAD
jgi:hypothetical protein